MFPHYFLRCFFIKGLGLSDKNYPLIFQVLGNAKGVVAVMVSNLIFRNPVSINGMLGYILIVMGVILYNEAKKRSKWFKICENIKRYIPHSLFPIEAGTAANLPMERPWMVVLWILASKILYIFFTSYAEAGDRFPFVSAE